MSDCEPGDRRPERVPAVAGRDRGATPVVAPGTSGAPASLCARLKAGTVDLHRQAERARLMQALLKGRLPRHAYTSLLAGLHHLYAALEAGLARHASHRLVAPWRHDGLARRAALEADLESLAGQHWQAVVACPREAVAYAHHLERLADNDPALLVAHAYVRYLGDLHGGQLIARIVARAYAADDGRGVAFYDFGDAAAVDQRIRHLRSGLDALALDEPGAERLVEEARGAYARHERLFDEVAASMP